MSDEKKYLTGDIKFADVRKRSEVPAPELGPGCVVKIREIAVKHMGTADDLTAQLSLLIVDEAGERIFTTPEQIANLADMPSAVAIRIFAEARKMSGLSEEGQDEIVKN